MTEVGRSNLTTVGPAGKLQLYSWKVVVAITCS